MPKYTDYRGSLIVWEFSDLPFKPKRTFTIFNVPADQERANHVASCGLALIALIGSVSAIINHQETIILSNPDTILYVKKDNFLRLKNFDPETILLVFAEEPYQQNNNSS